jgi:hypothetical protein
VGLASRGRCRVFASSCRVFVSDATRPPPCFFSCFPFPSDDEVGGSGRDAMRFLFRPKQKKKVSSGRGGDEVRCEPAAPAGGGVVIQVLVGALASHSSSSCESGVRIMGSDAVFTVHI